MDMVAVDTKLFITCRLCLEDTGVYRILPKVQEQIKFCFDIDVDPYDSLPQLICEKCRSILSEVQLLKQTFIDKQNGLKDRQNTKGKNIADVIVPSQQDTVETRSENTPKPQQESVHLNQENRKEDSENVYLLRVSKRRLESTSSVATDDLEDNQSRSSSKKRSKKCDKSERGTNLWENDYNKNYVCRLCHKQCKKKGNIIQHYKHRHKKFLNEHNAIFNKLCMVNLNKSDGLPNFTRASTVVLDKYRIIGEENRLQYYTLYTSKEDTKRSDTSTEPCRKSPISEDLCVASDASEEMTVKSSRNSRRRLLSNETVTLDYNKSPESSDNDQERGISKPDQDKELECINIDDSESENSNIELRCDNSAQPVKANVTDYKSIQKIISSCHRKYIKRIESSENDMKHTANIKSQLKHKILSIGRKVINKQGFSCTGLLRFIEFKNLEINWTPSKNSTSNTTNYVHIMTRMKNKEENGNDTLGWKILPEMEIEEVPVDTTNNETPACNVIKNICSAASSIPPTTNTISVPTNETFGNSNVVSNSKDSAVLYTNVNNADCDAKLLNATPVNNPKQLRKKSKSGDSKATIKLNSDDEVAKNIKQNKKCVDRKYMMPSITRPQDLCMPIITSTTSLADVTSVDEKNNDNVTSVEEKENDENYDVATKAYSGIVIGSRSDNIDHISDIKKSNVTDKNIFSKNNNGMEKISDTKTTKDNENINDMEKIKYIQRINDAEKINDSEDINHAEVINHTEKISDTDNVNVSEKRNNVDKTCETETAVPRIKVKAYSELMSERVLSNLNQMNNSMSLWHPVTTEILLTSTSNIEQEVASEVTQPISDSGAISMKAENSFLPRTEREYVVLDTVELPNTRTDSPFRYFRTLLRMHNIVLLDVNEKITRDFFCLIKFRLKFNKETFVQPIILCLSLHCYENKFYMGVKYKDRDQRNDLDLNNISANWQWEILKIYTGDVVDKLLKSAEKVSSEVHERTKSFLALLKSINIKRDRETDTRVNTANNL